MISKERNLKRRGKALPLVVPFFWRVSVRERLML